MRPINAILVTILFFSVLFLGYQLYKTQGQLQQSQQDFAQCGQSLMNQNSAIEQAQKSLQAKSDLLKQSASQQVKFILKQPQTTSQDAKDLNRWLAQNFTPVKRINVAENSEHGSGEVP